jgi:tetratricopeptide (TPR) repeat protein
VHCEIIAGSLDKALCALEELRQTAPDYPPALFLKAVIFCLKEKTEKMQECFQLLLQKGVQIASLLNKIAAQFDAQGKRNEARRILNAAIENKLNDEETNKLLDALATS